MDRKIKQVVKDHGFTMVQVADILGIKKSSMSQIIHGNPTVGTLQKIADVVGCQVGDFFVDDDGKAGKAAQGSELVCPYCGKKIILNPEKEKEAVN